MITSEKEYKEMLIMAMKGEVLSQIALALYKGTSSEDLSELAITTKTDIIKRVIMIHPNCPEELKVAIEL